MINTSEFKRDKQNEKITRLLANYESNIIQLQAKLKQDLKVNERFKIRKLIKTKQTKERKLKNNILYKVEILKTEYNSYDISINNAEKNKTKVENHLNKVLAKCQKLEPVYRRSQADFLIYRQQKKEH
ncbi:hypothetical protein [Spiroplasma endosymbiont of Stenodema calcarata]|uniref:hypothetical protein n=1 Tax=Spiroplasma endosymbiont of Stenodema calcarata TaxID=3139328 RepID=UPI003CCAC6AC